MGQPHRHSPKDYYMPCYGYGMGEYNGYGSPWYTHGSWNCCSNGCDPCRRESCSTPPPLFNCCNKPSCEPCPQEIRHSYPSISYVPYPYPVGCIAYGAPPEVMQIKEPDSKQPFLLPQTHQVIECPTNKIRSSHRNYCPNRSCCDPCSEDSYPTKVITTIMLLPRMAILLVLFLSWFLYDAYAVIGLGSGGFVINALIFLAAGLYLGRKDVRSWCIEKGGCSRESVVIPRNYAIYVLVLLSFTLKGFWAYFFLSYADIPIWMYLMDIVTTGLVAGFFMGRAFFFLKNYIRA